MTSRSIFAALSLALVLPVPMAFASDITATPPIGSGFAVKDNTGADQFRVEESGEVTIPGLPGAATADTAACFDSTSGQLGPCAGLDFANFYALMPNDNAAPVGLGEDVDFPRDGPTSGGGITRDSGSPSAFNLATVGTYQVMFQVSVAEAGQLVLTLDEADLAYTVVGRATGTSQIVGIALVTTTEEDSILTVRNPIGNATALTITPFAGGTHPSSAHLVITQLR